MKRPMKSPSWTEGGPFRDPEVRFRGSGTGNAGTIYMCRRKLERLCYEVAQIQH